MTVSAVQFSTPGVNPFVGADIAVAGSGIPLPQFKVGMYARGDSEAEFIYAKFVASGSTTLYDGSLFTLDKDYTATQLTTSNSPRGTSIGVCRYAQVLAAGTYYLWLQVRGRANVRVSASAAANTLMETTATASQGNAPGSPTTGTKVLVNMYLLTAQGSGGAGSTEANLLYPHVGATN